MSRAHGGTGGASCTSPLVAGMARRDVAAHTAVHGGVDRQAAHRHLTGSLGIPARIRACEDLGSGWGGSVFSETVRAHRLRLGVTEEELAGRTGISVRSIREIEAGRIGRPQPGTDRLVPSALAFTGAHRGGVYTAVRGPIASPGKPLPSAVPR